MYLNLIDYMIGARLKDADISFTALVSAAMRKGDTNNLAKLKMVFPEIWGSLQERYNSDYGIIEEDKAEDKDRYYNHAKSIAESYLKKIKDN